MDVGHPEFGDNRAFVAQRVGRIGHGEIDDSLKTGFLDSFKLIRGWLPACSDSLADLVIVEHRVQFLILVSLHGDG